jgi:tetratricopeptide (TPR) repeat protein
MSMLPPKEVPAGLSDIEYQTLLFRYQFLVWPRQMAKCQKILLKSDAAAQSMSDEGRKRMALLMTALEATFFVNETVTMVQDTASDIVKIAATGVGGVMDKNPVTAQAKKNVMLMAGMAKHFADGALHKVVSDVVLPSVGLPTDFVPPGRTPEHYLGMAVRYEQFGFAESARMALKRAIEADPKGQFAGKARVRIRTRLPKEPVPDAATRQYLQGLKSYVIKDYEGAKGIFEGLLRNYPDFEWAALMLAKTLIYLSEVERAQDVAMKVYRYNPNIIGSHLVLASIDVVAWRIKLLEERLNKVRALDPQTAELAPFESLLQLLGDMGLRQ